MSGVSISQASQFRDFSTTKKMTDSGAHTSESSCRRAAARATLAWSVKLEALDRVDDDGRTMRQAIEAVLATRHSGGQRQHGRSSSRRGREIYSWTWRGLGGRRVRLEVQLQ